MVELRSDGFVSDGSTHAERSLKLLRLLNEARRIGQGEAARLIEEYLDEHDQKRGYHRRPA